MRRYSARSPVEKGKLSSPASSDRMLPSPSNVRVAMGDVEAILPRREQVPGERYRHGERIRVYVVNVARGIKGPEIVVSRSHPELVRKLFEREVPELVSGAVSIMAIAGEAGARTKIAVKANTDGVNPKGALIGPGGARVRAVMENLQPGEGSTSSTTPTIRPSSWQPRCPRLWPQACR